jgi:hypothetical protein
MKKLTFILSISLTLSAFGQVPNYVPTDGLVGWWPFNGNANDESGNGNNGTVNGATLTADRFGTTGSAYQFNAANSHNIVMSAVTGSNALTVSYWVLSSISNNGVVVVQNNISNSSQTAFSSFFGVNNNNPSNLITGGNSGGVCSTLGNGTFASTPSTQYLNAWQNISIVYLSNGNVDLFINGQIAASQNGSSYNVCNQNNSFRVGGPWWNNDPCYFQGKIDDIGIWNRALTPAEVLALYNGCSDLVTEQPSSQAVTLSESNAAEFTVNSAVTNPGYQWQTNLGLGYQNLSDAGQYSGSATNTLTVNNLALSNNNQLFRCIISDGACSDTTDAATLTILDDLGFEHLNMGGSKKLLKITDLNGKETAFKKNTVLFFIYEDGTVERVYEVE